MSAQNVTQLHEIRQVMQQRASAISGRWGGKGDSSCWCQCGMVNTIRLR